MNLKVIGSSSKGNCILIQNNGKYVMLDCGMPFEKVLKAVDFKVSDIDFCFACHRHSDHISAIDDVNKAFIPIYSSADVKETYPFVNVCPIGDEPIKCVGEYGFKSFELQHDEHNIGLILKHFPTDRIIAYICDTGFVKAMPIGVSILIIECNYINAMLHVPEMEERYVRVKETHMSLERLESYLKKIDRSKLTHIILVHLSDRNADEAFMVKSISDLTGVQVTAASNGKNINLDEIPW